MPKAVKKLELTQDIIDDLKKQLEDGGLEPKIYKFVNDGDVIVFRPLMFFDYSNIQAYAKQFGESVSTDEVDRMICEKAIMWPEVILHPVNWEMMKAGIQSNLSKQILARSGFLVADIDQSEYMSVEPLVTVPLGPKPTPEVVDELKSKHKWPLYLAEVEGEYYVIRPVSRQEWRALGSAEAIDRDLMYAERVTVWSKEYPNPCKFSDRAAGVTSTITTASMGYSGFNDRSVVEEL